jgi:LemA protein
MAEVAADGMGGMGGLGWLVLLAALLGLWMLGAYNRLTALRGAIISAWAPLGAALQARAAAFDTLLFLAAGPLASEQAALDAVAAAQVQMARAVDALGSRPVCHARAAELAKADAVLLAISQRLLALVGAESALRAVPEVGAALKTLHDLQARLQFCRQAYNEAVQRYNAALTQFPTRLLGPVFRFDPGGPI